MKRKTMLTTRQANALHDWFTAGTPSPHLRNNEGAKQNKIALNCKVDRRLIELIGSRVGFDRFGLDCNGLHIVESAVLPLMREVRSRRELDFRKSLRRVRPAPKTAVQIATVEQTADSKQAHEDMLQVQEKVESCPVLVECSDTKKAHEDPLQVEHERRLASLQWLLADESIVQAAIEGCSDSKERRPRKLMLERLRDLNARRLPAVREQHLESVESLRADFPNFSVALDLIRDHLSLLLLFGGPLSLPPLLLLGPPGVGKTFFVKTLGEVLNLTVEMRSLAETSASFVINGSHQTWGGAQAGAVAKLVLEAPKNTVPLLLLDEIDKANKGNYSPENIMLGLLEPHTAQRFRDEYLDVEMDVRPLAVFATANVAPPAGSPLASRLTMVTIGLPTVEQMAQIVRSVDRSLRIERPVLEERFEPLSEEVIQLVKVLAPRALRKILSRAYAVAARMAREESRSLTINLTARHLEDAVDEADRVSSFAAKPGEGRRSTPVTQMVGLEGWSFRLQ